MQTEQKQIDVQRIMAEGKLREIVNDDFKAADKDQKPREKKYDEYYALYRCYKERTVQLWRNNVFVPIVFEIIETEVPRIMTSFFAKNKLFTVQPREAGDIENARAVEQLLDYQLTYPINSFYEIMLWLKQALLYGSSPLKYGWKTIEEDRVVWRNQTIPWIGMQLPMTKSKQIERFKVYDDPTIETLDIKSVRVDPMVVRPGDIQRARFVIHSYTSLKSEIDPGTHVNLDRVVEQDIKPEMDRRRTVVGTTLPSSGYANKQGVKIKERWGKVPAGLLKQFNQDPTIQINAMDDELVEAVVTLANEDVIIRAELNPILNGTKPFIMLIDQPVHGDFWGIGEIEPIAGINTTINDIVNQRIDNVTLAMNMMYLADAEAGIKVKNFVSRPGGIIKCENASPEHLRILETKDVTASSFKEVDFLKAVAQGATGVTDYLKGMNSPSMSDTATGISILTESAQARVNAKIMLMQKTALAELAENIIKLDQQFIDKEKVIRVIGLQGLEWRDINPEEILGAYDFVPTGSLNAANKQLRTQQLTTLLGIVGKMPFLDPRWLQVLFNGILEESDIVGAQSIKELQQMANLIPNQMGQLAQVGMDAPQPNANPAQATPGSGNPTNAPVGGMEDMLRLQTATQQVQQ